MVPKLRSCAGICNKNCQWQWRMWNYPYARCAFNPHAKSIGKTWQNQSRLAKLPHDIYEELESNADTLLDELKQNWSRNNNVPIRTHVVIGGNVAQRIVNYANNHDIDLIVINSRSTVGRGRSRQVLGTYRQCIWSSNWNGSVSSYASQTHLRRLTHCYSVRNPTKMCQSPNKRRPRAQILLLPWFLDHTLPSRHRQKSCQRQMNLRRGPFEVR